jgi:hypothetical protein
MALNRLLDKDRDPLAKDASSDRSLAYLGRPGTLLPGGLSGPLPPGWRQPLFWNDTGVIGSMAGREVIDLMGLPNPEER